MRKCTLLLFLLLPLLCSKAAGRENLFQKDNLSGELPSSASTWVAKEKNLKTSSGKEKTGLFNTSANDQLSRDDDDFLRVAPDPEPGDGSALKTPIRDNALILLFALCLGRILLSFPFINSLKRKYV
ncbi:MAG: hypothetical protein LUG18_03195 [Candidatus Azobacteroides sp.]|nr:hypothetical protein [Candidatus Azobacteroides sp.]